MAKKTASVKRKQSFFAQEKIDLSNSVPWVEDFIPVTIEDLAVHKKKISEVQTWLQNFFSQSQGKSVSPILILTGPPGVGKTATVKAICKSLKAELFVWSNSQQEKSWKSNDFTLFNSRDGFVEHESQALAFSRFLLHASKYSLFLENKRIILVEEFPNVFLRNPEDFHTIMRKYSFNGVNPAIFIISDNVKGESVENRLFPKDLQMSLKMSNISFNPVAPTMLLKILNRINSSSKIGSRYTKLNKSQLESIASDSKGDIRNAINTMQFLCMTDCSVKKSLQQKKSTTAKKDECSVKRDSSLFLFHALGKILYCKRDSSLKSETDILPEVLKSLEKDPLVSNPEEVFANTSISADAFNLFLQENFLHFVDDIDKVSKCSTWMSEADILSAHWNGRDVLNDYAVSLASRGLQFNLQSASKRWRALHKPQFYENNKKKNSLTNSLKYSFKGATLSMRELQIDLVPYISKLPAGNTNPAQRTLARELGDMNVKKMKRIASNTLDEKDCFEVDSNDTEALPVSNPPDDNKDILNSNVQVSDEDVVIEEYDF